MMKYKATQGAAAKAITNGKRTEPGRIFNRRSLVGLPTWVFVSLSIGETWFIASTFIFSASHFCRVCCCRMATHMTQNRYGDDFAEHQNGPKWLSKV